jgi:hypothetical protein
MEYSYTERRNESIYICRHKRSRQISDGSQVSSKEHEVNYLNWDEKLTFKFNGNAPAVKSLKVEKDNRAITLFFVEI